LPIGTFSSFSPVVLEAKMSFFLGVPIFITVMRSCYSEIVYNENA
jgi:hypothetical protein